MTAARRTGGFLTQQDLLNYRVRDFCQGSNRAAWKVWDGQVVQREPLVSDVGNFTLETFPAPASGAILIRLLKGCLHSECVMWARENKHCSISEMENLKKSNGWTDDMYNSDKVYAEYAKVSQQTQRSIR